MSTNDDFPLDAELAALLSNPSVWADPPPLLGPAVVARVCAEVSTVSDQLRRSPDVAPGVRPIAHRRMSSRSVRLLAVAAGLALAIGSTSFLLSRQPTTPSTSFALSATPLQPDAVGNVKITETTSGLRIELNATGLPRRDGNQFYEAWCKGPAGLVPVGTFHSGEKVTLWAGVALKDFPGFTITQEEVGSQDSSGKKVLSGTAG